VTKLAEIQTAIRQLAPQEQLALRHWLDEAAEETPEMLAAIDAGMHSLAENGGRGPTRAELEARVKQWAGGSR
jgi:hypothetical protein